MSFLKISTWNARGVQSTASRQEKINYLMESNFDILFDDRGNIAFALKSGQQQIQSKYIKSIKNKDGEIVKGEKMKREIIRELCADAYKEMNTDLNSVNSFLETLPSYSSCSFSSLLGNVKKEEVLESIKQLNTGKSPGPDGLPTEFYQLYNDDVLNLLTSMFNKGLQTGCMGESFYEGVMCLLYKKGDETDVDNYRHLTIMNTDYKILAKIIMNRLNYVLDEIIDKEQTCAVKGRVMWDNLCILREILNKPDESKGFFILGLDQKKAFDYISRDYLWAVLKAYGFPLPFTQMIKCLYVQSKVRVKVNGVLTDSFEVQRGVKQGCPLSAALYVLAISPLIHRINNDRHISGTHVVDALRVKALAYADDVCVIIKNQTETDFLCLLLLLFRLFPSGVGYSCLTSSVSLSISIANKKGLKADPWCSPTSTLNSSV
uniref:Reverse transcriptase domain-containing protein n=1 Tax=Anabas testudineus TaxID=64144 RepID=A0A3Q1K7F4_ANATE